MHGFVAYCLHRTRSLVTFQPDVLQSNLVVSLKALSGRECSFLVAPVRPALTGLGRVALLCIAVQK